jgi:hypothetical protein
MDRGTSRVSARDDERKEAERVAGVRLLMHAVERGEERRMSNEN